MRTSKYLALLATASFALALTSGSAVVLSQSIDDATCTRHPCAGYSYEVSYDLATGKIRGIRGWDASAPNSAQPGQGFILQDGTGSAVVPGDGAVADILSNANDKDYKFDTDTGRIERISEQPKSVDDSGLRWITHTATSTSAIPVFSLVLGVVMSAASVIARRRSSA